MWLRVTGDPAKNPNQAEKMNRHICNQSHLCFPFKKKKVIFLIIYIGAQQFLKMQ